MNFKAQETIVAINAPESFEIELNEMQKVVAIKTTLRGLKSTPFFIGFVTKQKEVDVLAKALGKLATEDEIIWFAYPKGTSKKYTCEFNRDNGWAEMGKQGFEGVRVVAIDADWSALRFRRVENIKTMARSFAMTKKGKEKTKGTVRN